MSDKIVVTESDLRLMDVSCTDPEVVEFFTELSDDLREGAVCRALGLGVAGLRAVQLAGRVDLVQREFDRLKVEFHSSLTTFEQDILTRVDATFDPARAESVSARLGITIAETYKTALCAMEEAKAELTALVSQTFNPDLTGSATHQIATLVRDVREQISKDFDPRVEGSHVARIVDVVEEYFGEHGAIADTMTTALLPVRDDVLKALQDLRDLVVGQQAAAQARRNSSLSGEDFEDEVEIHLCALASSYGDSVQRVGDEAGDAGASKKGDFIVTMREGPSFIVEAKDHSRAVTLRGERGILAALDAAMVNRSAGFAIGVARETAAFPKEVGLFNDYGDNKILCAMGEDADLLTVAYRWARSFLLAQEAGRSDVDVDAIDEGIKEARLALKELSRIEAKAKGIDKLVDDIQGIAASQIRRAIAALDQAMNGLMMQRTRAS